MASDLNPESKEAEHPKPESSQTPEASAPASAPSSNSHQLTQHHVSKILDEVLEEESDKGISIRHPMILDVLLAVGLLLAMGSFTIGLIKIYITHSAQQSISQRNYKAAIAILRGAPLPGFFNFTAPGSDPEELLNQALYLDAMDKLEANSEDDAALRELEKIRPGSRFFETAQGIVKERVKPSPITLQGQATHEASPSDQVVEETKPLLPDEPQE